MKLALICALILGALMAVATAQVWIMSPAGGGKASGSGNFVPPVPTVTDVSPNAGPVGGGTAVVITGTGLSGATAVTFGATNAASFSVASSTTINAVSPAHTAGTVDVTVTTAGGTSSANPPGDQFTFTACSNSLDFTQSCNSQYVTVF